MRAPWIVAALAALTSFLVVPGAAATEGVAYQSGTPTYRPGAAAATSAPVTAAHPFGYPAWLPLRSPARVGCVMNNCTNRPTHAYWAIDFRAAQGEPVYAAGAGIAHIGGTVSSCSTSTSERVEGTWIWIDHGGGVYSRYTHLSGISITEGQQVGPDTRIGSVGHSGTVAPCQIDYLHFEVSLNGYKHDSSALLRPRVDPGPLAACWGDRLVRYPTVWGLASWDDVPHYTSGDPHWVSSTGTSCGLDSTTPAATAAPTATVTPTTATLAWGEPDVAVNRVVLAVEEYHPSVAAYGFPTYVRTRSSARAVTLEGLLPGRPYRIRIAYSNDVGAAAWSPARVIVPMGPPDAPTVRSLTSTRQSVRLGWATPVCHGTRPTGYVVGIRRLLPSGTWSAWSYSRSLDGYLSNRWAGLAPGTAYQVGVHALSKAGPGPWSVRSVRTLP